MVKKTISNKKEERNFTRRTIDINQINGNCAMETPIYGQIKEINKISKKYYPELNMELLKKEIIREKLTQLLSNY